MNKKYIILLVIALVLVLGVILLWNINKHKPQKTTQTQNNSAAEIIAKTQNITLTSSGFNPQKVTIKSGIRIVWTNKSGEQASVNSDQYPNNLLWPFLNLGILKNGSTVSVIFEKKGKYSYHNQLKKTQTGIVVVE